MRMINMIFKIDKNQDSQNWDRVMAIKDLPYGLMRKKVGVNNKKIKDFSEKELKKLQTIKVKLEEYFKKDGQKIFKALEKVTAKPIYNKNFYVSFASAGFCPYDMESNWFMVPARENFSKQLTVICHDLLHLQVGHCYKKYCLKSGLTGKQFLDLNESLTFLLNEPEFKKFKLIKDEGYPKHKNLRKNLKRFWTQKKDFCKLIDMAVKEIKNSPPC